MDKHYEEDSFTIDIEILNHLRKIIKIADIYSTKLKEKFGINSSQFACLLILGSSRPISLHELSQNVYLSQSMITTIVDQLEAKRMVRRVRNSPDRRVILIELTDEGKETIKVAPPSFQKMLIDGLSNFKEEEKIEINRSLAKLISVIISKIPADYSFPDNNYSQRLK